MAYYEFDINGEKWTSEDYTLAEMVAMETVSRYKWWAMDFAHEAGPQSTAIEAYYARHMSADEAKEKAGKLTARQIRVRRIEGDDLPNEFHNGIPVVDPKDQTGPAEEPDA